MHKSFSREEGSVLSFITIGLLFLSLMPVLPGHSLAIVGTTVDFSASMDTYINQDHPSNNYGTDNDLDVRSQSGSKNKRTLVAFDLSSLPAGITIQSAILKLYVNNAPPGTRNYEAHRITASWTEGGANWNNSASAFDAAATATTSISSNGTSTWDVTTDVSAFYAGSFSNYGWLIKDANEDNSSAKEITFTSRDDGSHSTQHPVLEVVYTLPPPTTGTLVVIKNVVNDNGGTATSSDFTINVNSSSSTPSTFSGSSLGTNVTVDPGSYSVSEVPVSGYAMSTSTDCSGTIAAGETKTCTITNDDIAPQLTVIKDVVNDNSGTSTASDFTINIAGTNVSIPSFPGNSSGTVITLDAGAYDVTEAAAAGYAAATSTDCSGIIAIGESKTCTITNNDLPPSPATLVVIKQVINDNGGADVPSDFTMQVTGSNVSSSTFPGDASGTTILLSAGDYSISENQASGYAMSTSTDCSGTIAAGETKTCTITNDDIAPQLTIIENVINDDSGTSTDSDFTINVAGTNVSSSSFPGDSSGTVVTLDAGTYSVTEATTTGYSISVSVDCSGTIAIGESKICTITSNDIPPGGGGNGGGGTGSGGYGWGTYGPYGSGNTPPAGGIIVGGGGQVLGASTTTFPAIIGQVLGASTSTLCTPYISSYMGLGRNNVFQDVVNLQLFLNEEMGANIPITGFFGPITNSWVSKFQLKYAAEILTHWVAFGLPSASTPTGYVYKTTLRWINMLKCPSLNLPVPQLP